MSIKKYRLGSDSAYGQHIAATSGLDWIDVPDGVSLQSEQAQLIWAQFTQSRLVEDWTLADLVQLGKVVQMESDMRDLWAEYHDHEIMEDGELNPIRDKLMKHIDPIQKQQLSIIRSMGLNTPSTDPRTMAKAVENVRNHQATAEKNKDSLLAQPHH
jgi:hypothetical protein